jgi:hypothetical protein
VILYGKAANYTIPERADAASQNGARHTTTTTTRIGSALVVQIWEQFIFKKKLGKG